MGYGVHGEQWKAVVAALHAWAQQHSGVHDLPAGAVGGGVDLRRWISARRHEHRTGTLEAAQVTQLELVPGWTWGLSQQQRWDAALDVLTAWVEAHGSARVPTTTVVEGFRVGAWVSKQRSNHLAGTLSGDRSRALAALPGWTWAPGR